VPQRILKWTRNLRRQRPKNAFWGERDGGGVAAAGAGCGVTVMPQHGITYHYTINIDSAGAFPRLPPPSLRLRVPSRSPLAPGLESSLFYY